MVKYVVVAYFRQSQDKVDELPTYDTLEDAELAKKKLKTPPLVEHCIFRIEEIEEWKDD